MKCQLISKTSFTSGRLNVTKNIFNFNFFNNCICNTAIAVVALDTRLGCLGEKLEPDSEPQQMIDSVHTLLAVLHNLEIGFEAFVWRIYPSPSWRKFVKVMDFFVESGL